MSTPSLKERLASGKVVHGAFMFMPSPAAVELLAAAGFDFVIIDQEHSPKSWETVENMLRAAEACGMAAVIRVQRNEPGAILHALEVGAHGVVVPFVRSVEDVRAARAAMLYPPHGVRGLCTQTRTAGYGIHRAGFADYAGRRAQELVLIGLIEDPDGIRNIGSIAAEENGLDAMLIGRGDLAATMGRLGDTNNADLTVAVQGAIATTLAASAGRVPAGITIFDVAECPPWRAHGCNLFVAASEANMFLSAAQRWISQGRTPL